MKLFEELPYREFGVNELERCSFHALFCEIDQIRDGSSILTQSDKYGSMNNDCAHVDRRRNKDMSKTPAGSHCYERVLGQILYVGRMTNPTI